MIKGLEEVVRLHATNIDPNLSLFETMLRLAREIAQATQIESQRRLQDYIAQHSANQLDFTAVPLRQGGGRALALKPKAQCPVDGCSGTPIRPQRNFCSEHARTLDDKEKLKLRAQQKVRMKEAARG